MGWGRESCLGLAEISSLCSWYNSQDESKFSSFVCDVNQGNDEFGYKKVVLRISCEPTGMETFLQDLLQIVKKRDVVVCKIRSNRMS